MSPSIPSTRLTEEPISSFTDFVFMLRLHSDQCIGYLGHRVIGDLHAYRTDLKDSTMAKKMNQAMTDFFSLLRCIGTVKI